MKRISLIDGSLIATVYYEETDSEYDDDICICFQEPCPEDERLFKADETNIYLTPDQANQLAMALIAASKESMGFPDSKPSP